LSIEANHNVAELLQESKHTGFDDMEKLIHEHYRDSDLSELVLIILQLQPNQIPTLGFKLYHEFLIHWSRFDWTESCRRSGLLRYQPNNYVTCDLF